MPIPDDPRLELLSGAFVRNGFSFSYRSDSWTTDHGFIVDGEGAIQPGRQKGDAAYGPKKPPPLPSPIRTETLFELTFTVTIS